MAKEVADYLLKCPICNRKMWLRGAQQHRKAKHRECTPAEFIQRLSDGVAAGKIQVRRFGQPDPSLISGTQRLRAAKQRVTGIRSVVSGGKIP